MLEGEVRFKAKGRQLTTPEQRQQDVYYNFPHRFVESPLQALHTH
jgi:hypothetical protein